MKDAGGWRVRATPGETRGQISVGQIGGRRGRSDEKAKGRVSFHRLSERANARAGDK